MPQFAATGQWAIYSVQKTLPYLGQIPAGISSDIHSYLVLVDPTGKAVQEMQGVYTNGFSIFGPTAGNYLQVQMWQPNQYMSDQSVLSQSLVMSGSQAAITSSFNNAFNVVANDLNSTHDLYNGASLFSSSSTYNSNSVWYTAMQALGISNPAQYEGGYDAPGSTINLNAAPTKSSISDAIKPYMRNA